MAGAQAKLVAPRLGTIEASDGSAVPVDFSFLTASSVLFDAVYVPGGAASASTLRGNADAIHFVDEAFKHCKTIAATTEGVDVLAVTAAPQMSQDDPVGRSRPSR
jgi:catalase